MLCMYRVVLKEFSSTATSFWIALHRRATLLVCFWERSRSSEVGVQPWDMTVEEGEGHLSSPRASSEEESKGRWGVSGTSPWSVCT
jgi:hypothetical protein